MFLNPCAIDSTSFWKKTKVGCKLMFVKIVACLIVLKEGTNKLIFL